MSKWHFSDGITKYKMQTKKAYHEEQQQSYQNWVWQNCHIFSTKDPKALFPFSIFLCDRTSVQHCSLTVILFWQPAAQWFCTPALLVSYVWTQGIIRPKTMFLKQDLSLCSTWKARTWWLPPGGPVLTSSLPPPHHWHTLNFLRMVVMLLCCFPERHFAADSSIMSIYIFKC